LGDRKPKGHGCYHKDYWSGRISVRLTTVTPLLIPDAAEMTEDNNGHKTYPIRLDANGKPYLPPTSIKGMLRSVYEAVTNSRLSVFEKHDKLLAYRMSATEGITAKPARIEQRNDGLYLRILEYGGAAKLPRYEEKGRKPDKGERKVGLKYLGTTGQLPQHGERVAVKLSKGKVTHIQQWNTPHPPSSDWKIGWVCVTGANIGKKQNERVFIQHHSDPAIKVNTKIIRLWEDLITDYQKIHEKDLEERKQKKQSPSYYESYKPGQTSWSRHIYDLQQRQLKEGILCYVELDDDCDLDKLHPSDIIALQPVTISRRLYSQEPNSLLPESLHPAADIAELSPADRVFGWVNQKNRKPRNKTSNANAYKGQLRVHSVECKTSKEQAIKLFDNPGLPLAILGEPKPAQTRFYTAENKSGKPINQGEAKEYGYESVERGLRGRKVYPHHRTLPDNYWDNSTEDREYRHPSGEEERNSQNKSITGWVEPHTEFNFDMDIVNLSNVELGALLWLLNKDFHHRLGGGKPLGFGSVTLEITSNDLRIGADWQKFYSSLNNKQKLEVNLKDIIEKYQNAVASNYKNSFERVSFIVAFCRCKKGFEDGLPIHYPRLNPTINSEGKNYEWFTQNEGGEGWSLPSLVTGESLPLNPRPDKDLEKAWERNTTPN
jgi:CRISPR-associated protein (TIGR03986 family)